MRINVEKLLKCRIKIRERERERERGNMLHIEQDNTHVAGNALCIFCDNQSEALDGLSVFNTSPPSLSEIQTRFLIKSVCHDDRVLRYTASPSSRM